jgi:toluene monooxygenase system protein E
MAPSSYVMNTAYFQAADELRRVQWAAYRARSLALAHGEEVGSSGATRATWEDDPAWQPLRQAVETMLVAYDWGEAFAALDLAVKPVFDALYDHQLAELARQNGDELTALMLAQFALDAERSREWSRALVAYAVERRAENREVLRAWVDRWTPVAERGADALARVFAEAPVAMDPEDVSRQVRQAHREHLEACGF